MLFGRESDKMALTSRTFSKLNRNNILYVLVHRNYSAVNENLSQLQIEEAPGRVENGVPFLFLPHTVKKAYEVKSGVSTSLPRIFDKYKWLTKTLSSPYIPEEYLTVKNHTNLADTKKLFHDSLAQTVAFIKSPKNKDDKRFRQERMEHSMFSNFIKLALNENNSKEHLQPTNFMMLHESLLETHWVRDYKFYQTQLRPTHTLKTLKSFDIIEEPVEIYPSDVDKIPGPYHPYDMNLYRQPIVHLVNRAGMDNSRFSPIKHCHTSVTINNRLKTDEQLYTLGMFTMYTQLAAQAQSSGILHGMELEQPLVTQCIVSNGHLVSMMLFQLNTLNMLTDKGLWNRCWYLPAREMFERNNKTSFGNVHEEAVATQQQQLAGFDDAIVEYFLALFGREPHVVM